MLCPTCLGDGCQECKKGFIRQERRPGALIGPEGSDLFQAYKWLKNYGTMPVPGGLMEQAAAFVDAVEWCDSVHAGHARTMDRRNAEVSKVQAGLQKMMGKNANRKR